MYNYNVLKQNYKEYNKVSEIMINNRYNKQIIVE